MFYKRNEITREKEKIMGIRTRLAVLACKTSNAVLRRMGRGGTNLPGKIALKIDKDILKELSRGDVYKRQLMESGVRRENRKQYVDQIAAVFILQGYLDSLGMQK